MSLKENLNKNNLHHAYLIEGASEKVVPEILEFLNSINITTAANPDFSYIELDSFKIDDARSLKSRSGEKSVDSNKKIFLISANNILLEAQNTMLKMFEEPGEDTHFFIVLPDINVLLPTFVSRFYVIRSGNENNLKEAEVFLKDSKFGRIEFLKGLIKETEDEEEGLTLNSARGRALRFLNSLEEAMHKKGLKDTSAFKQIFNVRKFLRQPGSSAKSLMESVALIVPNFKN